jgi:glycosyltransferase involved in cell wall biosynthesis
MARGPEAARRGVARPDPVTVLYCADTRFPIERANGAQTMATCHALAQRGHDVTLVVRPDTTVPARDPFAFYGLPREPRLVIRPVASSRGPRTRRAGFVLAATRLAARHRGGIVYTRDLGLASFLLRLPAFRRPRLIYESHGVADVVSAELPVLLGRPGLTPSPAKLRRLAARERRVWTRAAGYVTITRALADELTNRFGPRPHVFVVPDGAPDALVVAPPLPLPRTPRPVVAYAGHLYPWKGVDVLIRALALAPGVDGLVIGGHPQEADRARVEALARDLRITDRVTFTGHVPPGDVAGYLSRAMILALPNTRSAISSRYTSPLKLFEYLALGRAIVASDLPAIREVLTEDSAVLVPPDDPEALAAAIRALAADPTRVQALAARARALAPSYTWQARATRLEAAIAAVSA